MEEEKTNTKRYKTFEDMGYDYGLEIECEPDYDIPCLSFCDI